VACGHASEYLKINGLYSTFPAAINDYDSLTHYVTDAARIDISLAAD
jgi:hypothetical protein